MRLMTRGKLLLRWAMGVRVLDFFLGIFGIFRDFSGFGFVWDFFRDFFGDFFLKIVRDYFKLFTARLMMASHATLEKMARSRKIFNAQKKIATHRRAQCKNPA